MAKARKRPTLDDLSAYAEALDDMFGAIHTILDDANDEGLLDIVATLDTANEHLQEAMKLLLNAQLLPRTKPWPKSDTVAPAWSW